MYKIYEMKSYISDYHVTHHADRVHPCRSKHIDLLNPLSDYW